MQVVADPAVARWVADRIPGLARGFGPCASIGVIDDAGRAVAGFVFHDLQTWPTGSTMQLSLASDSPRWLLQRHSIARAALHYPFYQQGVWKVWTAIPHTSERTLKLGLTFGFTREAMLVDHFGRKKHAMISRMFRKDYDRVYGVNSGQKHPSSANAA
jgi:hypothetical protein